MGSSFKLEKGGNAKEQARTGGLLVLILGIITFFLVPILGFVLGALGLIFLLASFGAKE
jgi:multisubunit Na+/H+ antiporter MnhG subunit